MKRVGYTPGGKGDISNRGKGRVRQDKLGRGYKPDSQRDGEAQDDLRVSACDLLNSWTAQLPDQRRFHSTG